MVHNTLGVVKCYPLPPRLSHLVLHVCYRDKLTSPAIKRAWRRKHPHTDISAPTTLIMGGRVVGVPWSKSGPKSGLYYPRTWGLSL